MDALQAIADILIKDNPNRAHVYTPEWVQKKCATLNKSPEEYLADLQAIEATAEAVEIIEDQPWTKELPFHYKEKLTGAIDGFSYGLMKQGGEQTGSDAVAQENR